MIRILVVEDETFIREELIDWLQFEGYEVYEAENGAVGVELAKAHQPDLIICDIRMPKMNGEEVLLEIRSNPQLSTTPFIFATASVEYDSIRRGMNLGADDYITKPYTHDDIMNAIKTRLKRHQQEQAQAEAQLQMMQAALETEIEQRLLKSRMVAMFSHDFRNPLALIQSSASLLTNYYDRLDKDKHIEKLKRIASATQLLTQMLDDMLLVAEMENPEYSPQPESLDVDAYVRHLISDFVDIYHTTHHFEVIGEISEKVYQDPKLLRQIMNNLLSNAVKYSPQNGEIRVTLSEDDTTVHIAISDNGIGMPEDYLANLFTAFQRADNAKHISGTGLGLAIVQQAIQHCEGSIAVESEENVGTTFTVSIPKQPVGAYT
ncbi:MAG: ATP-binding protein [Chloroflexota bacterium]